MVLSRWVFLRILGLVYLAAFASLLPQIRGLIGSQGILPAHELLEAVGGRFAHWDRFLNYPTLAWIDSSDGFLSFLCGAGVALSLALTAGLAQRAVAAALWVVFLSINAVGGTFLSYQWEALLLETGFIAIFLAPPSWLPRRPGQEREPSPAWIWIARILVFRLMFGSGFVKLASGDPTWSSLSALLYHYETQPLPNAVSWYVHQLPEWFHTASCLLMFVAELAVPWLVFAPRRWRAAGGAAMIALQLLFVFTGNFAYFNWLSIALCVLLLDDGLIRWALRRKPAAAPRAESRSRSRKGLVAALSVMLFLHGASFTRQVFGFTFPFPFGAIAETAFRLRLVSQYGLFAVMTRTRDEIVVEGSDDGERWLAYELPWKPGDPSRMPGFVAPHQPRLDWQLWFAAFQGFDRAWWVSNFLARLLEGSPDVLALLERNPFPDHPPKQVRTMLYRYHFTTPEERRATGNWWRRELLGAYGPVMQLR